MNKAKRPSRETASEHSPLPSGINYEGQAFDIMLHALLGRFMGWLSPAALSMSIFDWWSHLRISPARQAEMIKNAWLKAVQLNFYLYHRCSENQNPDCIEPHTPDPRFKNDLWRALPFDLYAHTFSICEQWWNDATTNIRGVAKHREHVVNFITRQLLDIYSPSNFPLTNPEVINKACETGGRNFIQGWQNFFEDTYRIVNKLPPVGRENFQVGVDVAVTPGKVIYQNQLIELIQYTPTTAEVYAEPILIIPAWIMKYYILDLSPYNSLVKYLVSNGHTVFMISWKNPDSDDRNLGLEDYLNLGIYNALEIILKIVPVEQVHAVGYCLGGTLLMIAAAAMAGKSDKRFKSVSLFAAQIDFKEAGELTLFIDQSQVTYLEDIMWERGYLDGSQMANAFSMLHSNDLIWSRMIHDYLLGERRPMNDLMAWDSDTTRLPYRMHSEYLHHLFLNNDLAQGRYKVNKKKIALIDIKLPIFAVGTLTDHVSPWKSVYKVHLFTDTEVTFVLTSGGHNAGIVSEPGHRGRSYQLLTRQKGGKHLSVESWQDKATHVKGSWWLAWQNWLVNQSGQKVKPPSMGLRRRGLSILGDAPGSYVLEG